MENRGAQWLEISFLTESEKSYKIVLVADRPMDQNTPNWNNSALSLPTQYLVSQSVDILITLRSTPKC
jgi:hypothetical protein